MSVSFIGGESRNIRRKSSTPVSHYQTLYKLNTIDDFKWKLMLMPYKGAKFSEPLVLGCFDQITINFETNVGSIGKIQVALAFW